MTFTKHSANLVPIEDTVFAIVKKAKEDIEKNGPDKVVDATIGSLYGEDGVITAYDSVFTHYDEIDKHVKAAYASSFVGNPEFRKAVYDWVIQSKTDLPHSVIATPGGSGAVSITMQNILDKDQTVVIPDICWGSYNLMASQNNFKVAAYSMFDGDHFNIESFKQTILDVKKTQDKILVVINDPCHNPTGYTLTNDEWQEIISFLNECSKDVPCVILDDIAYIDYAYDLNTNHDYMKNFNQVSDNLMVIIAFSCSKTLTSYGLRCGAAILLAKDPKKLREVEIVYEKSARAIWSNIPNAAMNNFSWVVTDNKDAFLKEKQTYVDLLKERSTIFVNDAKACGLPIYPYKEGFFVTIKMKDNEYRNKYHQILMDNHIYTVAVNKGIRVAICSLPLAKITGLAAKMKALLPTE